MVTLGISTNTRLLGLAIINNKNALLDYSIHLYKSSWSPSKANHMILTSLEPCVRQYSIKSVILSTPYVYHQNKAFKQLVRLIKEYFEEKNITVHTKTPENIYSLCPPDQKKTKKALMEVLRTQYPQLTLCYYRERRNKNRYYIKVFEAVAAVTLHQKEE